MSRTAHTGQLLDEQAPTYGVSIQNAIQLHTAKSYSKATIYYYQGQPNIRLGSLAIVTTRTKKFTCIRTEDREKNNKLDKCKK